MHAAVFRVTIKDVERAQQSLESEVVPRVSSAPGFVAGYWTRSDDGGNGLSIVVFESEDAARTAAERASASLPDDVTLEGYEIREVIANA